MKWNNHNREGEHGSLSLLLRKKFFIVLIVFFVFSSVGTIGYAVHYWQQSKSTKDIQKELQRMKEAAKNPIQPEMQLEEAGNGATDASQSADDVWEEVLLRQAPEMLPEYKELYDLNQDMIGWLTIDGTNIDYPVMQTIEDECYYLTLDFYGEYNRNGCLIMDTDSVVGTGTAALDYTDGTSPSTNLIIHGHTMKSGDMFGNLPLYAEEAYGKEHSIIRFDSLYEEREYELIAVFYSQVFYAHEDVFKYYKFFQADTQEEFDDWYNNIKEMSLYDTGVTAEPGDEFITLSCCAYHVEDGRFVVVGRRK